VFSHDNISIREIEVHDLEAIRRLRNEPSTWMMLTAPGAIEPHAQESWFHALRATSDRQYFVIFDDHHPFIGIVRTDEIDRLNRSIRVGADVVPELRGRGFGSRVYSLLKKYCFDHLNVHRLWLAVLENNERAIRLYERHGFRLEGRYREAVFRDGRYLDYLLMSILDHEYRSERSTDPSVVRDSQSSQGLR
jgi:UDP-4-amino-4,6-dideoxy-N-acetyl-beta-L-altrosamine N-acetyltransferase